MSDEYTLCPVCRDCYAAPGSAKCHACREQDMIDDIVPTPFDWSVWDDEYQDGDEDICEVCGWCPCVCEEYRTADDDLEDMYPLEVDPPAHGADWFEDEDDDNI